MQIINHCAGEHLTLENGMRSGSQQVGGRVRPVAAIVILFSGNPQVMATRARRLKRSSKRREDFQYQI
jgi:hypothetical protein